MKVAVIGATGQLGRDICRAFTAAGAQVAAIGHAEVELAAKESVQEALGRTSPHLIVNCAAMHHVEKCEADPAQAMAINALGEYFVATTAQELGATLIYISTDYVFDGVQQRPYVETDIPRPLNVYGISKLAGEMYTVSYCQRSFVVRVSAIFGLHPCRAKGQNFVELMLRLARERGKVRVVDSEIVSPTFTEEIADQLVVLAKTEAYGIYHATAAGQCSWYDFAEAIFRLTDTKVELHVADAEEFPAKVPRPKYSVLENRNLQARKIDVFKPWKAGLERYLAARSRLGCS